MGAAVLSPQDSLINAHHLCSNGSRPPPRQSKPPTKKPYKSGSSNRPGPTRKQRRKPAARRPGQVIDLKRGEDLKHVLTVGSRSDGSDLNVGFAGPAFAASPPASDVPIPAFCRNNNNKIMADCLRYLLKL